MMSKMRKQTLLSAAIIIGGLGAIYVLSGFLERHRPALPENYADADLSVQGARLKGYALGFEGLLADWYWMNSLQYLGDKILGNRDSLSLDNLNALNPRLLYPYLNTATDLDPKFISVYEYGATVLPAIDPQKAIALTEKGIANNPDNWRLYQYLGYIYWRLNDYERAAAAYEKGSEIVGAADFMRSMTAKMRSEGGKRETARAIYRQIFDAAQDAQSRENAALRLKQLDSLDEREAIQSVLNNFKTKNNRCAADWREITPLLKDVKLPDGSDFHLDNSGNLVDPTAAPYLLNRADCTIKLDTARTKIPLV